MKQDKKKLYHHRWASNNSVAINSEFDNYQPIADSILHNGEPGVVNLELSRNYGRIKDGYQAGIDGEVEGTNPCGEISLANGEPCNLFEVFPFIAQKQGWDLKEEFKLAARYTKRVTLVHMTGKFLVRSSTKIAELVFQCLVFKTGFYLLSAIA